MTSADLPPLIVVVGPTAAGKSSLAIALASACGGEIVCADSRTQYRWMDIGTAKPTPQEQGRVPHHLLSIIDPDETFSLAQFQDQALQAIAAVTRRASVPFLVGGSGLYVKSVVEGFRIPQMQPNRDLRAALEIEAARLGPARLHDELELVDPAAAQHIQPGNVRRVIRALEVYRTLGVRISEAQTKSPPPYRILILGVTRSPESIRSRIAQRVDAMLAAGLVEEVQALVARGYGYDLPAMSGIGYREVGMYLRGEIGLGEARDLIMRNTRRFVRRQHQWFRLTDPNIEWFNLDQADAERMIVDRLRSFGIVVQAGCA